MAGEAKATIDHDEIRKWAEARGGKPATVKRTESDGEVGVRQERNCAFQPPLAEVAPGADDVGEDVEGRDGCCHLCPYVASRLRA